MNRRTLFSTWASVLLTSAVAAVADEPAPIKVVSYNLRYASLVGENSWLVRRPIMKRQLAALNPDIVGTQEGLFGQLKTVADDLPEHRWIGLGREGGSRGEFMAIFYRADRFDPIEYDHYWLSDTPEVIGSSSWGNQVKRMVTWVKFHDRLAKREFYFVNTHFDHQVETARQKSAQLLLERTQKLDARLPVIITGDFNTPAENSVSYETLVGDGKFRDAWREGVHGSERTQSFNGFRFPARTEGPRIDWILLGGPIRAEEIVIDDFAEGEQYPSDHFPVVATLRYSP